MNEGSARRIVITKEELADSRVDEVLDYQHSYTPTPVEAPPAKFRLVYSAWFYLMVAGALGALAAWGIIEPNFQDQLRFTGKIESVQPDAASPFYGTLTIHGMLTAAGVDVYIAPEKTVIQAAGTKTKLSLREITPGSVVTVLCVPTPRSSAVVATAIRLENPRTAIQETVMIPSLEFQRGLFAFLLFPAVAGLIGLMLGAVEGIVCRTYSRAAWCGAVGLLVGLVGGSLSVLAGNIIYGVLGLMSSGSDPMATGTAFVFQMFRRGLAWTVAGMTMGLGQGFALKSSKLRLNGFIGGMVGALIGGLLFDPIALMLSSPDGFSGGGLSRAVGIAVIGATVGLMIGFTDMLTRDAWLKVLTGPLQGKEFSFNVTPVRLGSSPKNEIYLFKDAKIDPLHAEINKLRDAYELVDNGSSTGTFVNDQPVTRIRLTDGARIKIGDSEFSFSSREKKGK